MMRLTRPAIAGLVTAAALMACKGNKDQYASGALDTSTIKAMPSTDTTTPPAAVAVVTWAGPTVIAFTETASDGEIRLGRLAQKKAISADVKAYARRMVNEHNAMLADSKKLATKLKVSADTTAADVRDLATHGHDALTELTNKAEGADWDRLYMDKMVEGHQNVLTKLQNAANGAGGDVRSALDRAIVKVEAHLAKAKEVRAKLG